MRPERQVAFDVMNTSEPQKVILLTFDVEDWFQVENLRRACPVSSWSSLELRIERSTHRILDALDSGNPGGALPKATFFVLGWIAERVPDLVREIHARGHEVASHGYSHRLCGECSEGELVEDLEKSKKLLEDIIGNRVKGYRAPNFSISDHILRTIEECGYTYDSSYNSFAVNPRYGRITLKGKGRSGIAYRFSDKLYELPISNLRFALNPINRTKRKNQIHMEERGFVLPWGGGGYFRIIPFFLFHRGVQAVLKRQNAFSFYLHPWEFDPGQPRVESISFFNKFRHYLNLGRTEHNLQELIRRLQQCHFATCCDYLNGTEAT